MSGKKLGRKAIENRLTSYFDENFGRYTETAEWYGIVPGINLDDYHWWWFELPDTKQTVCIFCNDYGRTQAFKGDMDKVVNVMSKWAEVRA